MVLQSKKGTLRLPYRLPPPTSKVSDTVEKLPKVTSFSSQAVDGFSSRSHLKQPSRINSKKLLRSRSKTFFKGLERKAHQNVGEKEAIPTKNFFGNRSEEVAVRKDFSRKRCSSMKHLLRISRQRKTRSAHYGLANTQDSQLYEPKLFAEIPRLYTIPKLHDESGFRQALNGEDASHRASRLLASDLHAKSFTVPVLEAHGALQRAVKPKPNRFVDYETATLEELMSALNLSFTESASFHLPLFQECAHDDDLAMMRIESLKRLLVLLSNREFQRVMQSSAAEGGNATSTSVSTATQSTFSTQPVPTPLSLPQLAADIESTGLMLQLVKNLWSTNKELVALSLRVLQQLLCCHYSRFFTIAHLSVPTIVVHLGISCSNLQHICSFDDPHFVYPIDVLPSLCKFTDRNSCEKSQLRGADAEDTTSILRALQISYCSVCFFEFKAFSQFRKRMIELFLQIDLAAADERQPNHISEGVQRLFEMLHSIKDKKLYKILVNLITGIASIILEAPLVVVDDLRKARGLLNHIFDHFRTRDTDASSQTLFDTFLSILSASFVKLDKQCIRGLVDVWLSMIVVSSVETSQVPPIASAGMATESFCSAMNVYSQRLVTYLVECLGTTSDRPTVSTLCELLATVVRIMIGTIGSKISAASAGVKRRTIASREKPTAMCFRFCLGLMEFIVSELNRWDIWGKLVCITLNRKLVAAANTATARSIDDEVSLMKLQLNMMRFASLVCEYCSLRKVQQFPCEHCETFLSKMRPFFCKYSPLSTAEEWNSPDNAESSCMGIESFYWEQAVPSLTLQRLTACTQQSGKKQCSKTSQAPADSEEAFVLLLLPHFSEINALIFLHFCKCVCTILLAQSSDLLPLYLHSLLQTSFIPLLKYGMMEPVLFVGQADSYLEPMFQYWCSYTLCLLLTLSNKMHVVYILKRYNDGDCCAAFLSAYSAPHSITQRQTVNGLSYCPESLPTQSLEHSFHFVKMNIFFDLFGCVEGLWKKECAFKGLPVLTWPIQPPFTNLETGNYSVALFLLAFKALQHVIVVGAPHSFVKTSSDADFLMQENCPAAHEHSYIKSVALEDGKQSFQTLVSRDFMTPAITSWLSNKTYLNLAHGGFSDVMKSEMPQLRIEESNYQQETNLSALGLEAPREEYSMCNAGQHTLHWSCAENPFVILLRQEANMQKRIENFKNFSHPYVESAAEWILNCCLY